MIEVDKVTSALEEKLNGSRKEWTTRIKNLVSDTKDMSKLTDSQITMLSDRQRLVDKMIEVKYSLFKLNAKWDKEFKIKYKDYSTNFQIKLTGPEKKSFIDSDLHNLKLQIEMIKSHIDFFQESIKTLDNLAYAIRNRIKLNEDEF